MYQEVVSDVDVRDIGPPPAYFLLLTLKHDVPGKEDLQITGEALTEEEGEGHKADVSTSKNRLKWKQLDTYPTLPISPEITWGVLKATPPIMLHALLTTKNQLRVAQLYSSIPRQAKRIIPSE